MPIEQYPGKVDMFRHHEEDKKIIVQHNQLWETSCRSNLTWVSIYAIRVGASVPHTDFSSSIGTAYCPIRPWTCKQQALVLSKERIKSEGTGKDKYRSFFEMRKSYPDSCMYICLGELPATYVRYCTITFRNKIISTFPRNSIWVKYICKELIYVCFDELPATYVTYCTIIFSNKIISICKNFYFGKMYLHETT